MSSDLDFADRPNRWPWPPMLLGGAIIGALLLREVVPFQVGGRAPVLALGLVAAAFTIDIWVFELFRRYRTEILPNKAAKVLVTDGPFRFSRNPIYVGNVLIILGGYALTASGWFLVGAVAFVGFVTRLAIVREEAHLEAQFGDEWREYRARVRRWL